MGHEGTFILTPCLIFLSSSNNYDCIMMRPLIAMTIHTRRYINIDRVPFHGRTHRALQLIAAPKFGPLLPQQTLCKSNCKNERHLRAIYHQQNNKSLNTCLKLIVMGIVLYEHLPFFKPTTCPFS